MEDDAANQLHVKVAHAQGAARSLPHQSEGFGQKLVLLFAGG